MFQLLNPIVLKLNLTIPCIAAAKNGKQLYGGKGSSQSAVKENLELQALDRKKKSFGREAERNGDGVVDRVTFVDLVNVYHPHPKVLPCRGRWVDNLIDEGEIWILYSISGRYV